MKNSSLKKNAVFNAVRVLMSMFFPLITFPYATRVLGVDNIGKIQFGLSIISYFALFAALGISSYGTREAAMVRSDRKAFSRLASEIFTINVLTAVVSYVFLAIILFLPTELANYRELIFIQSIVILFNTIGVEWVFSAVENYFIIAARSIISQFIALILLFVFVKQPDDYYLYAAISVIASAGANIFNFFYAKKYCDIRLVKTIHFKKHIGPLIALFSNALAVQVYINSDVVMLGLMCGDFSVGVYSVATKIFSITKSMLNAVVAVAIPRLAFLTSKGEMEKDYRRLSANIINICVLFALPMLTLLFLLSDEAIVIIGGKEFVEGGTALRILSFALMFAVISNFFGNAVLVSRRQEKKFLVATLVGALVNIILNFILIPFMAQNGAALTTVISEIVVMCISGYYARKFCSLSGLLKTFIFAVFGSALVIVINYSVSFFIHDGLISAILITVLSVIVYGLFLLLTRNGYIVGLFKSVNLRRTKK